MKIRYFCSLPILTLILCISCERPSLTKEPKPEPQTETAGEKKLVPLEMQSDKMSLKFEYKTGTGMLTKISQSEKNYILITYAPKFHRVERFNNNELYHYSDFFVIDGKASKVHSFDSFGKVDVPTGHSRFDYSDKGQLIDIKDYNVANVLVTQRTMNYSPDGNLTSLTVSGQSSNPAKFEYTSDNKNSIFKHVSYARLLFLELPYDFFCPDSRNWLSCKDSTDPKKDISYTYQYNNDGYPVKLTITGPAGKETFDVTYTELEK